VKRRIIVIAVVLLIAAVTAVGVMNGRRKKLPKVETVSVELADLSREISTNGEIGSKKHAVIVATVSGTVEVVAVEVGSRVTTGAVIARLDPAGAEVTRQTMKTALENARMTVRGELQALRAAYKQSLTASDQAGRDLARTQELHKIGSASNEELQRAKDARDVASESLLSARQKLNLREGRPIDDLQATPPEADEAIVEGSLEVRQATVNLGSADRSIGDTVLRAPLDGTVTDLKVEEGGFVTAGTPVAEVHDIRTLEVTAQLDEVDLPYVRPGQKVKVEADSFIGTSLEAGITRIAPMIRKVGDSRVCEIRADILNDEKGLARVGASCSLYITVEDKKQVPSIPMEAYLIKGKKKTAFKLVSGTAGALTLAETEIETGIVGIDKVEVVSGLAAGDQIVKSGLGTLKDGMEVERAPAAKPKAKPKTESGGKP